MIFAIGFSASELDFWCAEHGVDRSEVKSVVHWRDIVGHKGEEHSYVLGHEGVFETGVVWEARQRGFRPYAEAEHDG